MFDHLLAMDLHIAVSFFLWVLALFQGGAPERILTGMLLAVSSFDRICNGVLPASASVDSGWMQLLIDTMALVVIVSVASRTNRVYPVWLGGAQLVKLASRLWRLGLTDLPLQAHTIMDHATFALQLCLMAGGVAFHLARRRRRGDTCPNWIR